MRQKLVQYPLLNRMTTFIFVFGLIMAVSLSCFKLYLAYGHEIKILKQHLKTIDASQSQILAKNIWSFNEESIRIQLTSILQHPDIIYLQLDTNNDQYKAGLRPDHDQKLLAVSFPIFFQFNEEANKIANLSVLATTSQIKQRLLAEVPGIIAVEFGKMIIVCIFILILFHYLFNQHLRSITRFARNMDFNRLDQPLVLHKKSDPKTPDELDRIATAINDMRQRLLTELDEKEKLEDDLRHSQKMEAIGTLAGGIAHDFNNILTAIFGFTELATFHLDDQKQLQDDLVEVRHGAERAKELVQQILTFSRKSAHAMQPLKISTVVNEAVKLLRSTIPSTITIELNIKAEELIVIADATQIHQILMNICTNGSHSMRDTGGTLTITLQEAKHPQNPNDTLPKLELIISDTGCGINEITREKIFEPYFTTKEKGQGTGLGLAVVHGIVHNHKGIIDVSSQLGKGTTFRITLPTARADIPAKKPPPTTSAKGNNEHILYIDDEEKILSLAQEIIPSYGYRVTTFTDPVQAVQAFKQAPDSFDLIVTDMTMPKMTGIEVCQNIVTLRADIPILLCTGYSDLIDRQSALAMGVKEYIHKPIVMSEIVHSIKNALLSGNRR